ncbi:MAG: acyl-CoA thioesterase [Hahellaceae bacterium]|nr:acyl-CoA thioesterase [Hahellaceae bacterium]MCP5169887.1 acyl-CoA thioesterase [Hahellaceae bacterium]
MSRIKIEIPAGTGFSVRLVVRISDINYGGHLGHDRLISMLHEARMQFFQHWGYEELNVEGVGTVIADLGIRYLGEAFVGNELVIEMIPGDVSRKGFALFYKVHRAIDQLPVAQAKTALVFFDYADHKAVDIPSAFREKLNSATSES